MFLKNKNIAQFLKFVLKKVVVVSFFGIQFGYSQINVVAAPDHLSLFGNDTIGNIFLNVSGGTSPYTYTWMPGNLSSKDYTNASFGSYTVNVKDNVNNTASYNYNLGYKSTWTNFYNSISRNDSLIANSTGGVTRSAISKNVLRPNTDGWVEMIYQSAFDFNVLGFLDSAFVANQGDWYDFDFAVHVNSSYLYATEGVNWYFLSYVTYGDVVRIERINNVFYVQLNNNQVFSMAGINENLQVKGLFSNGGMVNIGTSFSDTTKLYPLKASLILDHVKADGEDSLGNVFVNVSGGVQPITFNWMPGNSSSSNLLDVHRDTYTLKITDALNDSIITQINLGYKTNWKNFYGTSFSNDTIYAHSAQTPTGSPSAISINELRPNQSGWAQFITPAFSAPYIMGFLDSVYVNDPGMYFDYDFAVHVTYGDNLYAYSSGYFTWLGNAKEGDILSIHKNGSSFSLKKNNTILHTDAANINKDYRLKIGLNNDIYMTNVGASFADSTSNLFLRAIASVDHAAGDGLDSLGHIKVKIIGGKSPYDFNWMSSNGSTYSTKSIYDLTAGEYTLKVKDDNNDSIENVYKLGFKAKWNNFYGTIYRNDSLMMDNYTFPQDSFPTARTLDSLEQDSSGWAEMIVKPFVSPMLVGFILNVDPSYNGSIYDIEFAFHLTYDNELYCWDKGYWYYIGRAEVGDAVRIERDVSSVVFNLFWNNNLRYTSGGSAAPVQLKAQIVGPPYAAIPGPIVGVGVGWGKKCTLFANPLPNIAFVPAQNNFVQIGVNPPQGAGVPPYSYLWLPNLYFTNNSNNTQANPYVNPPVNTIYNLTITDAKGCKAIASSEVYILQPTHAVLEKSLSGSFYDVTTTRNPYYAGFLHFKFEDEYVGNGNNLSYAIYNMNRQLILNIPSLNVSYKDNRYSLNLNSLGLNSNNDFYVLQVTDKKGEKTFLRFKY